MRNVRVIFAFIFMSLCVNATTKTVNLVSAGTLSSFFQTNDDNLITELTVTGTMDYRDFSIISGLPFLTTLDLSGVTISAVSIYGTDYFANEIPTYVFYNRTNLLSVSLPNSVTKIGMNAFTGCSNLASVNIPTSLSVLGYAAFMS